MTEPMMTNANRIPIFNFVDEWGLLVGIPRIPGETNKDYLQRLLDRPEQSSTHQGLVNWISEALLQTPYNVIGKQVFTSLRVPLSYTAYQALTSKPVAWYSPRITVGATTWTVAPTSDLEKDSVTSGGITWTLWKQLDGSYERVWTVDAAPTENVHLRYLWQNPEGGLVTIHEAPTVLAWSPSAGSYVEVDPDER